MNNYFALTPQYDGQNEAGTSQYQGVFDLTKGTNLPYSYNWPYDFFSLVENGKLDFNISYDQELSETNEEVDPSTPKRKR